MMYKNDRLLVSQDEKGKCAAFITLQIMFVHAAILLGDMFASLKFLKYAAFGFSVYILFIVVLKEQILWDDIKKGIRVYRNYFEMIIFLLLYSIILQAYHLNGILARTFVELYFIGIPLLFCILINCLVGRDFKKYIELTFMIYCVMFVCRFASSLTISNILSVSFLNSFSPFESEYAPAFSMLAIYFLFEKKYLKYAISIFLTILSMKRFEVVIAIFSIVGVFLIKKVKLNRFLISLLGVTANLCILGSLIFFSNQDSVAIFNSLFGTSLNAFTMGRSDFLAFLLRNTEDLKNGFGYTTYYLRQDFINYPFFQVVHGEQIKLYFEMGISGLIFFFLFFYKGIQNAKSLYFSIVFNIFFIFNHLMDNVANMFIFFMLIGYARYSIEYTKETWIESTSKNIERECYENFNNP